MAAAWQHNYWFWVAAACAVAGASAEWGPEWLAVERTDEDSATGRPVEVIRHPGFPPSGARTAETPTSPNAFSPAATAFPAPTAPAQRLDRSSESALQLPNRSSAQNRGTAATEHVRVAEYREPWGTFRNSVTPVDHRPVDAASGPVRLTGKIELIFDE